MNWYEEDFYLNEEGYQKSRDVLINRAKALSKSDGAPVDTSTLVFFSLLQRALANSNGHQLLLEKELMTACCALMRGQIEILLYVFAYYDNPES